MSKITKKELDELVKQEKDKGAILHDLGVLSTQKHSLSHMYADLTVKQKASIKTLEEKYGKININLQDGSYELNKEENEKNK
tara:strand:+ start:28 stop:273 length:246 start_codon:yes stop_codon:yes gene_type:complete